MKKRAFGDLEQIILNLFTPGCRLTVKEVQASLGNEDKYTTIMTVMNRLVEKKRLARNRVGQHYEYWIVNSDAESTSILTQLKKKLFGLKTGQVVNFLIESSSDITNKELDEIEKLIQKTREKKSHDLG